MGEGGLEGTSSITRRIKVRIASNECSSPAGVGMSLAGIAATRQTFASRSLQNLAKAGTTFPFGQRVRSSPTREPKGLKDDGKTGGAYAEYERRRGYRLGHAGPPQHLHQRRVRVRQLPRGLLQQGGEGLHHAICLGRAE